MVLAGRKYEVQFFFFLNNSLRRIAVLRVQSACLHRYSRTHAHDHAHDTRTRGAVTDQRRVRLRTCLRRRLLNLNLVANEATFSLRSTY